MAPRWSARATFERGGADFPLLAKFIDAGDHLSVQVHPDDSYAHTVEAHTGFHGKTGPEHPARRAGRRPDPLAWLARPTAPAFAQALADGGLESLRRVPARAGDTVFVPAGTIHAINAGIMLFEINRKSDLTYRVYDYDRRDAKTGQAASCMLSARSMSRTSARSRPPTARPSAWMARTLLVSCPTSRWALGPSRAARVHRPGQLRNSDRDRRRGRAGLGRRRAPLARGESAVLPASLGAYRLAPAGRATLLRCFVP